MNNHEIISALKIVYQKMRDDFVIRRRIPAHEVISALEDYGTLIEILEKNDWHIFGQEVLNKLGGIDGKYFGKGEFVSGFCPKIISYQESFEAQKALDAVVAYIRRRTDPKGSFPSGSDID